jgi:hypothetical protein
MTIHTPLCPELGSQQRSHHRSIPSHVIHIVGLASIIGWWLSASLSARIHILWPGANYWDFLLGAQIPGAAIFRASINWVPRVLPSWMLPADGVDPRLDTAMAEYLGVMAALFLLYGLALYWLTTHAAADKTVRHVRLLSIGAIGLACSLVMLFNPAAPSHDPVAYGAIGRLLAIYHANPYFVAPAAYPHDTLLAADEWSTSTQAYGPVWTLLSALLNPLVAGDPVRSVMVYRVVALIAHMANLVLIATAWQSAPSRYAAWHERGLLLYAWNPLVIIEVAAGHNDVLLLTLVLLGITLTQRGRISLGRGCFAMAVLLKVSAVPILGIALLALCVPHIQGVRRAWRPWTALLWSVSLSLGLVALGYLPFLWGHSLQGIYRASKLQGTTQGLTRALLAFYSISAKSVNTAHLLPAPVTRWLTHQWMRLDTPNVWMCGLAVTLAVTTFYLLPTLRRTASLALALAWIYAAWLGYLAIFNLLQGWYVVPLIGLVSFTPLGRPIRCFALTLAVLVELETVFLVPSTVLQFWHPWSGLLALLPSCVALIASQRQGRISWRRATHRSMNLLRAFSRPAPLEATVHLPIPTTEATTPAVASPERL